MMYNSFPHIHNQVNGVEPFYNGLLGVTLVPEAFFYSFVANFATRTASFFFCRHEALRAEKRKTRRPVGILTFMPSASDSRFWLEDIFNSSTIMIGWIKNLLGCDWSKENDVFDSCQVLSQHESGILNDLDQRLSFLSARCLDQSFASQISK